MNMSTGDGETPYFLDMLYPTDEGSQDRFDPTAALQYEAGLIMNEPSDRTFGSMVLRADTGGEYIKEETGFLYMGRCTDDRGPKSYGEDITYEYPEPRPIRARFVVDNGDRPRQVADTSDAEILGRLPAIGTGYQFVIDHRPAGHEKDYIPPREYTTYFANRQIPIAAPLADPEYSLHLHDMDHALTYAEAFNIPEFADMAATAAGNALRLPDEEGIIAFTNAMDMFGDALNLDQYYATYGFVSSWLNESYVFDTARQPLQQLVSLYVKSSSEEAPALGGSDKEVFDMLWRKLGYEQREAACKSKHDTSRLALLLEKYKLEVDEPAHDIYGVYNIEKETGDRPESYQHDFPTPQAGIESSKDFGAERSIAHNRYATGGSIPQQYMRRVIEYTGDRTDDTTTPDVDK